MFRKLEREEYTKYVSKKGNIAFYEQFSADLITPMTACIVLTKDADETILLESAEKIGEKGRYSCLGLDPYKTYTWDGESVNPWETMRALFDEHRAQNEENLPGFIGGAAGLIAYDAIRSVEKIPDRHRDQKNGSDIKLQFFTTVLCFDHKNQIVTVARIRPAHSDYDTEMKEVSALVQKLKQAQPTTPQIEKTEGNFETNLSDAEFQKRVCKAQEEIRKGEAFQIVLSRTFSKKSKVSGLDLYRALRIVSPSPFMFYIKSEEASFAGASPELLISLTDGAVKTMPIAGTRKRSDDPDEDKRLADELLVDEKEVAEHMMLVDLGRNDIGRVCKPLTVAVEKLKIIERFSHVMHIISIVGGQIQKGKDAFDLLAYTFPAGTLSGAPKIRAMEIIDELEPTRRGLYGGSVFSITSKGNLVACIAIRMGCVQGGDVKVQAGAGIVYDSKPELEAEETRNKAMSVMHATELAESGSV